MSSDVLGLRAELPYTPERDAQAARVAIHGYLGETFVHDEMLGEFSHLIFQLCTIHFDGSPLWFKIEESPRR